MKNRLIRTNSDNWNKVNQSEYSNSIVFIEDTKLIYANQTLYNGSITAEDADNLYPDSIEELIYLTKGPQTLTNAEKSQVRENINAQETLVSGTSIKTINGKSILGSGNIEISGSGGGISSETDPIFSASPAATITELKKSEWDNKMDKVTLSKVATSGSYNDLTDKPTIPSTVTESTVSDWGFTKNTGTITGVSANGTSVATSGVANIPAASTNKYGVTKLSSATNSTSTTLAATPSAVKSAYDLANGKQDKLVSGTSIKTINGESILGSGDIEISGGGSSSGSSAYPLVNYGTTNTIFTISPNTFYIWDEVVSLDLTLGNETSGIANEYLFQFISGENPTELILPDDIIWAGGETPIIESDCIYLVSILMGLASILSFKKSLLPALPIFTITIYKDSDTSITEEYYYVPPEMTWGQWCESNYNINKYYSVNNDGLIQYNNPDILTMEGLVYMKAGLSNHYCNSIEIIYDINEYIVD